jgi:glycerate kinase
VEAAAVFAPQKGATPAQVDMLTRRLERLVQLYRQRYGRDVSELEGAGAAGGLAGGLAAVGATLVGGFDLVADRLDLAERMTAADLVVTGEGHLDEQSFEGKSVGGVVDLARALGVPVAVVAGDADPGLPVEHRTLVGSVGPERAWSDPLGALTEVTAGLLARFA